MAKYRAKLNYLGNEVEVESDSFAELHEAMAGVSELNRSYRFLATKVDNTKAIVPDYREVDGNKYYGVRCAISGKNVSFGQKREKGLVPFFPKESDGYFDPAQQQPKGGR